MKVVLISSGQPALNPRLVKEADALADAGHEVLVIFAYWNNWGDVFSKKLLAKKKWTTVCAGGHPVESPFIYFISRVLYKVFQRLYKVFSTNVFADVAIARAAFFLAMKAKKHSADLYTGHNLGALPAVIKTAGKYNAKCGFDAEDFHRCESNDDVNSFNYVIAKAIEDKYFSKLDYLTASSPLIADQYHQLYPHIDPAVILNVFPTDGQALPVAVKHGVLKLFWFSQTIGSNRGIENIAAALKLLNQDGFELHLLGYISDSDKQELINTTLNGINVVFHEPMPPDEIISFAAQFDIGLASENNEPFNRDICLTNKIFTYMQAGLVIVASDTTAQSELMSKYPQAGKIYKKNDPDSLLRIIGHYLNNPEDVSKAKSSSFRIGREELNWENESVKFVQLVNSTLGN